MGALCLLGYLGTILFGPLLGNSGKRSVPTHSFEACVQNIECYFWFNHYVDCIKGAPVFEMFEARIRVIMSKINCIEQWLNK
jgi:hypothetical protein